MKVLQNKYEKREFSEATVIDHLVSYIYTGLVPLQEKMHAAYFVNLDSDNKDFKIFVLIFFLF